MRYTIPTNKEDQKKEIYRMFHTTASNQELQTMRKALSWLIGCADGTTRYDRKSYRRLYDTYKMLGITEGKKETALFPAAGRNEENFRNEIQKLWRILQVHAQEKNQTLLMSYQNYQKTPDTYDTAFRSYDRNVTNQRFMEFLREPMAELRQEQPEFAERSESRVPLVNANSPYAHLVKDSAYSELYDLSRGLQPQLRAGNSLPERLLQDGLRELLGKMQIHYLRRNSMGNVLPMTKQEHKEILELYQDCLRDCRKLPDQIRKSQEYKKLHSLLLQNENQLMHLPDDALPPLADVLHGLKGPSIHLIAQEKETIGNAISSREAVEYMDADGNLKRGFFTAEQELGDRETVFDAIADKYEKRYPEYSDYFKKIKGLKNNSEFARMLDKTMNYYLFHENKNNPEPVKTYFERKSWIRPDDKKQEAFWKHVMIPVTTELAKNVNMQNVLRGSGLDSRDLLAERSGAMSDIARSLGYPDLVVRSQRMTVKRGDREETGIMMESADINLVDPAKLKDGHPFYDMDAKEFDSRQMISSLADLQILDYLCANTDRHGHNFFYRMDFSNPEKPGLLGVQGIDNDNSFGNIRKGGKIKLAKASDLKIITPGMADAVSAMTEEQLQNVLSPYHLSDQEIKAAGKRLKDLQSMISKGRKNTELEFVTGFRNVGVLKNPKGTIHIMRENDWQQLNLSQLLPEKEDNKNIFLFANSQRSRVEKKNGFLRFNQDIKKNLQKAKTPQERKKWLDEWTDWYPNIPIDEEGNIIKTKKQIKAPQIDYKKQQDHIDYRKVSELQKKELSSLEEMLKRFDDAHGRTTDAKRSAKFKAMRGALEELTEEYRRIRQLDPDEILINEEQKENLEQNRDKNLSDSYRRIEQKRQNLKQAINTYLDIRHWRITPSENNQKRINAAKILSGLVQDAPSSEQFYKSSKALQDEQRSKATSQDALEQNRYLTNEIHGMMKYTLRDNVNALSVGDPLWEKGLRAMEAQERLWNYSQSSVTPQTTMIKTDSGFKEKTSLTELLRQENIKKAAELPNSDKICADLNVIKEYAPELGPSIDQIVAEKNKLTPRRVGGVLSNLFVRESKTAKERKEAAMNTEKTIKLPQKA